MISSKEKLSVEVANINGVQVNAVDMPEATHRHDLHQLASDASRTDYQSLGGQHFLGNVSPIYDFEFVLHSVINYKMFKKVWKRASHTKDINETIACLRESEVRVTFTDIW